MEIIKDINNARGRPWIDYSSLSTLMRCPRQYWWEYVHHIRPAGQNTSLINGTAYHEAVAAYHKLMLKGVDHEMAVEAGLGAMRPHMLSIRVPNDVHNLTIAETTLRNYFRQYQDEVFKTIEAEIPFAIDLGEFIFAGKVDAVKMWPGYGVMVNETKTSQIIGKRWQFRGKPNLQIDGYVSAVYLLSGEMPYGAILDVIPVKTEPLKKGNEPFTIITTRTKDDVNRWIENVSVWWRHKLDYEHQSFFPMNTDACVPLVGFGCDYTSLCKLYPDAHDMGDVDLPESYKKEEWAPYDELLSITNQMQEDVGGKR